MNVPFLQRLGFGIRSLAPFVLTSFLVLLGVVPWSMPAPDLAGGVALIAVFYWALHRPELLPPIAIFAIGLVQDSLSGGIMGLTPLILLSAHGVVRAQRRFFHGKPFVVAWWGFLMVAAGAGAMTWAVTALFAQAVVDPAPAVRHAVVTILVYPLFSWLFGLVRRTLPD